MTTRTTSKDLARAFERFMYAAAQASLGTASQRKRWAYSEGSRYYGNSFKLYQVGADTKAQAEPWNSPEFPYGSGHHACATLPAFLGWSKAEAVATLDAYSAALEAPIRARELASVKRAIRSER